MRFIQTAIADLHEYYREEYRKQHELTPDRVLTAAERFPLLQAFSHDAAREFMKEVPAGGSVLDIGCSAGGFLSHLQGKYELYGSEWNAEDAQFVRETGGIRCEEGTLEEIYPGKTFTAAVLLHVFEHQPDPVEFLKQVKKKLIGGGWLYIEVPNITDALLAAYQIPEYASFWYREPHITYWNAETLASALSVAGFEATVSWKQRYGLANHLNWILNKKPMADPRQARGVLMPVDKRNPLAPALNRIWWQLDQEYRIQMETNYCTDTLRAICRRREI